MVKIPVPLAFEEENNQPMHILAMHDAFTAFAPLPPQPTDLEFFVALVKVVPATRQAIIRISPVVSLFLLPIQLL
jgi:hypothetical protein